ncbi:hypothetical protein B0H14DRAFT_3430507 [Mycena olivaceomarginata]|nr:hypothetical protein B0H14DRAFT_3430507 [Mycena olivaceomarginata]
MVKPSDIPKLTSSNYWTWKPDAEALFDNVDSNQAIPTGVVQLRKWTENNTKVYGLLYLTLDETVKTKVNNANVQRSGHLLWGTLESIFMTLDPSNRALLMMLSLPAERNLTAIAVSLPTFTVHDKILNGLSSIYSPITALLQNESPQHDVASMFNVINNWENELHTTLLAHVQVQSSSSSSATGTATPTVLSAVSTPASTPLSKKKKSKKNGPASLQSSPPVARYDYGTFTVLVSGKAINNCGGFTIDGNCNRLLCLPVDGCNTGGVNGKQWNTDPGSNGSDV